MCIRDRLPAADRAVSLDRACELVMRIIAPSVATLAANKYTKVDPVVRKVALMTNFLDLLRQATGMKLGRAEASGGDWHEILDWDSAIGIPKNTVQH